jgi:fumarate hydratase class II
MITAYATLKKAAAIANHDGKRLDDLRYKLIVQVCDEILAGQHHDMFPLHVWMTGSGTQFNMNVNEVISNRCWPTCGHAARQPYAGASQRSCQHGAVVERHVSVGDAHRGSG